MIVPARRRLDDRGFTLIELIVTVAIMGVAFVAVIMALGAAVKGSGRQRAHAALTSVLLSTAEDLRAPCDGAGTPCPPGAVAYVDCAPGYAVAVPEGFSATATVKGVWDSGDPSVSRFAAPCDPGDPGTDTGLQLIELEVSSAHSQLRHESLLVVKRRP